MSRSVKWCLTINNPEYTIEEVIQKFKDGKARCAVVGDEQGESGTRHYQAYVNYGRAMRFVTLKKLFPSAHIEKAQGNDTQNLKYCSKDGKFQSFGEFKDTVRGVTPKSIVSSILKGNENDYIFTGEYIRKPEQYQRIVSSIRSNIYSKRMQEEYRSLVLYDWQLYVYKRLISQNRRQILWISDQRGGYGKSHFARWLHYLFGAIIFDGITTVRDIAMMLPDDPKIVVFDITRSDSEKISYNSLESIKNGYVMSGKYGGYIRKFDPPFVIVLSNVPPREGALSLDRIDHVILDDGSKKIPQEVQTQEVLQEATLYSWPTYDIEEDSTQHHTNEDDNIQQ